MQIPPITAKKTTTAISPSSSSTISVNSILPPTSSCPTLSLAMTEAATMPKTNPTSKRSGPPPKKRKTSFQIQGKRFLLTYPRCATTKQQALDAILQSTLPTPEYVLVVQESHADGSPHLHLLLCFHERVRPRDPRFFDFITGKHGDYKTTTDIRTSRTYLLKEDKTPLEYGTFPEASSSASRVSKSTEVANLVLGGSTLREIATLHPSYFMLNKRKIEEYRSFVSSSVLQPSLLPLASPITYSGSDQETSFIVDWLNLNLFTTRGFKSPQLFLTSPPNYLKTTLVNRLASYCRIYYMPPNEEFYDFYSDDDYDLVVLDEFVGNKKLSFLNHFIQGNPCPIPKKGSQSMKIKNLPVIFLSNFTVCECYQNQKLSSLAPFQARLSELVLTSPIDLANINFDVSTTSTTDTDDAVSDTSSLSTPLEETEGGSPILRGKAPIDDEE